MFNKTQTMNLGGNSVVLAFLQSTCVKVFPCGRRRAQIGDTEAYIPFDPEARLNTEANAISHSSLNGFTQNYIKNWGNNTFSIVLNGYLFTITSYSTTNSFGETLTTTLKEVDKTLNVNRIYANIRIEETPLYSAENNLKYNTYILRDQKDSPDSTASADIDLLKDNTADPNRHENYYFSGLSFSSKPITSLYSTKQGSQTVSYADTEGSSKQRVISLCILEKVEDDDTWYIHQPALLPKIEHGDTENSVKLFGDIETTGNIATTGNINTTGTIEAKGIKLGTDSVPSLKLEHNEETGVYQLKFSFEVDNP